MTPEELAEKMKNDPPEMMADNLRGMACIFGKMKTPIGIAICRLMATIAWCTENGKLGELEGVCMGYEMLAMDYDLRELAREDPDAFLKFIDVDEEDEEDPE